MRRLLLVYCFSFLADLPLLAQPAATIQVSVSPDRILIGQPLKLTIEVYRPAGSVTPFLKIDSIPHFEFSGMPVLDSSRKGEGWQGKAVYTITSFDSGQWTIPSFSVAAGIVSAPIPVAVVYSDFDPQQDYHDIKDILEPPVAKRKKDWYWYAAAGFVLLALLAWLLRRKKREAPVPVVQNSLSPYEDAMRQLAALGREQPGRMEWHLRLTAIFRLYVNRKKGLQSLQKTTEDLLLQLRQKNILEQQEMEPLTQALRLSDLVKFARYASTADEDALCLHQVREGIDRIEKKETTGS